MFQENIAKSALSNYGQTSSLAGAPSALVAPRQHCVSAVVEDIEMALKESVNSSANLADKLAGCIPECPEKSGQSIQPDCLLTRLEFILVSIRNTNAQLNRSHNAIGG